MNAILIEVVKNTSDDFINTLNSILKENLLKSNLLDT